MKLLGKILITVLITAILCGAAGVSVLGADLPFAKTEKMPGNWVLDSQSSADFLGSPGRTGSYALVHHAEANYSAGSYVSVENIPSGAYTLSAYVKSSGGQNVCYVSVSGYGGSEIRKSINPADDWQRVSISFSVSGNSASITLFSDAHTGEWVMIDDISLVNSGRDYAVNGGFETLGSGSNIGGVTGGGSDDNAVPRSPLSRRFAGWYVWSDVSQDAAFITTEARSGKNGAVHYSKSATYGVSVIQDLAGVPQGEYACSIWTKSSGGQTTCTLTVQVDGGSRTNINIPASDDWVQVSTPSFTVKDGQVQITIWSYSPAGKWLKFDDAKLYRLDKPDENLLANPGFEIIPAEVKEPTQIDADQEHVANEPDDEDNSSEDDIGLEVNNASMPDGNQNNALQTETEPGDNSGTIIALVVTGIVLCILICAGLTVLQVVLTRKKPQMQV